MTSYRGTKGAGALVLTASLVWSVGTGICYGQSSPPTEELTLQKAIELATQNNRQIHAAEFQVQQARQATLAMRTNLYPQIDIEGQHSRFVDPVKLRFDQGMFGNIGGTPIPTNNVTVSSGIRWTSLYAVTLGQPITQIPRINTGIRLAEATTELAKEQSRERRLDTVNNVRRLYYSILQAEQGVNTLDDGLKALIELERTVNEAVKQEAALSADLLEVQARKAKEESQRLQTQDTLLELKERMNLLLGRDIYVPFRLVAIPDNSDHIDESEKSLWDRALANRPDLRQAALQVRRAELDRRATDLEYIPDLSIVSSYIGFDFGLSSLPDHVWTIGIQLSWKSLDWGKRRYESQSKKKAVLAAKEVLDDATAAAHIDLNSQLRALHEARAELKAARAALDAAKERLRVTMNRFHEKAALPKDVLQAEATLSDTNRQVIDAELSFQTADSKLRKAVGEE